MTAATRVTVATEEAVKAYDVTGLLPTFAKESGLLLASVPHTSAALMLTEGDDELLSDLARAGNRVLVPLEPFAHSRNGNPNGSAHIASALFGTQVLIPVDSGQVSLGAWQRLILLELDGPKERHIDFRLLIRSITDRGNEVAE
jgi:secondary thiamine-phosphate synthase enzyme